MITLDKDQVNLLCHFASIAAHGLQDELHNGESSLSEHERAELESMLMKLSDVMQTVVQQLTPSQSSDLASLGMPSVGNVN